jgi:hypothetical protein
MIKGILIVLLGTVKIGFCQPAKTPVAIINPENYSLVGELGYPLGTTISIEGIVIDGPHKGYADGPNILILSINDSSIQNIVEIPITPYFSTFGSEPLPEIETGRTYRFRVYETGEFVGVPDVVYKEANIMIQTSGFHFQNKVVVISGEAIEEKRTSPKNFIGRTALIMGVATNINDTAYLEGLGWKLKLVNIPLWDTDDLGKNAQFLGHIEFSGASNTYITSNGEAKLTELKDLENKHVKLRGIAKSMNGQWWFDYRGTNIFVEKMNQLPNWSAGMHFQTVEIWGTLKSVNAECVDREEIDSHLYCSGKFIVVNPQWKLIDGLLIPEILIND